jgi:hypothetical protein
VTGEVSGLGTYVPGYSGLQNSLSQMPQAEEESCCLQLWDVNSLTCVFKKTDSKYYKVRC